MKFIRSKRIFTIILTLALTILCFAGIDTREAKAANKRSRYTICIDPGHQQYANSNKEPNGPGSSTMKMKVSGGTHGSKYPEYKVTLSVGKYLKKELERRGYNVVMTRTKNKVDISNKERAQYASKKGADIMVRLHCDGSESSSANGASVLCITSGNPYHSELYKKSNNLSQCVLSAYCDKTGISKRGTIYTDTMTGLNWCSVPSTLIEMGFMTNYSDDSYMNQKANRKTMAAGIADGIDDYFGF